jgi:TRAP-type C4-dicarboxylate transport system permease small subunit
MVFIGVILIYFFILAILVLSGILIGYLLQWVIPTLSLGTSIIVGIVSVNSALYFFVELIRSVSNHVKEGNVVDDIDTDDGKHIFILPEFSSFYLSKRRRKKK